MNYKVVVDLPNGKRVWINTAHLVKMEKTPDDRYFVYLINGEVYEINRGDAAKVENCFEGRGWIH